MELWLKHSSALTYADDTSSTVSGKTLEEVKLKLKEDAEMVLLFFVFLDKFVAILVELNLEHIFLPQNSKAWIS